MHRGMALSGVNQALVMRDAGHEMKDESITAVALLAGNEVSKCLSDGGSAVNMYILVTFW